MTLKDLEKIVAEHTYWINATIRNSKLPSELENWQQSSIVLNDFYASINRDKEDLKKVSIPVLRGEKGDWNATTNTPTIGNGIGVSGDYYRVSVGGVFEGKVYKTDDVILYIGGKYINLTETRQNSVVQLIENLSGTSETVVVNNNTTLIIVKESNTVNGINLEFDEPLSDKITIVNSASSEVRYVVKSGSPISIIGGITSSVPGFLPSGNDSINQSIRLNLESNIYKIAENEFIATGLEGV